MPEQTMAFKFQTGTSYPVTKTNMEFAFSGFPTVGSGNNHEPIKLLLTIYPDR